MLLIKKMKLHLPAYSEILCQNKLHEEQYFCFLLLTAVRSYLEQCLVIVGSQ